MSEQLHFTRQTLLAASDFIEKAGTNAGFDLMVQRLELDQWVPSGGELSVPKKRVVFNKTLLERAGLVFSAREGQMTHGEALIREAVRLMRLPSVNEQQEQLERCLARDGIVVSWDAGDCGSGTPPWLRRSLPQNVDLPAGDDRVHQHLKRFGFVRSCGHLDQATVMVSAAATIKPEINSELCSPAAFHAMPSIAYRLAKVAAGDGVCGVSLYPVSAHDVVAGHALLIGANGVLVDEEGASVRYVTEGTMARVSGRVFGGSPSACIELSKRDWNQVFK